MDSNMRLGIIVIGGFFALWFILWGIMMRKLDFSFMFEHPWNPGKNKGMYMHIGFGLEKVADDTPETRKNFSKGLGNFFIGIGAVVVVAVTVVCLFS